MDSVLVFIDGTTCDERHRINLAGTPEFNARENVMKDVPTEGSVELVSELARKYKIIYIGARDSKYTDITKEWLERNGFPKGEVYLGKNNKERMNIVKKLMYDNRFIAGIGDRWDDNELHLELGCKSFILQEWTPNWDTVRKYLD